MVTGIPGWRSGLAPAFGPGRDPGDPGLIPTSGSRCMEPASLSACVSASLSLSLSHCVPIINKLKKNKKKHLKKKKHGNINLNCNHKTDTACLFRGSVTKENFNVPVKT